MLRWLQAFVRRQLVSDAPAEMSLCLDCGKLVCSESEFRDCSRRKQRAAELAHDWSTLDPERGADICKADAAAGSLRGSETAIPVGRRPVER